ncbi:MAG TPA: hypothetical protein VF087_00775 [Solirubrobacteraceae bacterium]
MTRLTPQALMQTRRWATLLATDDSAPAWTPLVGYSTPDSLRTAAQWLVDEGHAPGLKHEMVCVLLAIYVVDVASEADGGFGGAFIPRDAA